MYLVEIAHPAGALTPAEQRTLATELIEGNLGAARDEDVPAETLQVAATMTHVGFREVTGWRTGEGDWDGATAPPLWITVTVPEAWRADLSRHACGWTRRAVRRLDRDQGRERAPGSLWVNLIGIADGSIGMDGKPSTADDVVEALSAGFRERFDAGEVEVPSGKLLDPTCGMLVPDVPRALMIEHRGVRYGFCSQGCRDAYVRREGVASAGSAPSPSST